MLNRGDLIELDDNSKYFIADIFMDLGKRFITLVNEDDCTKLKFAVLDGDEVVELQNPKLIERVANISNKNLNKKEVLDEFI